MSDQPLTEGELKELLTAIGSGEFPVTADRIRRLVAEVRERREREWQRDASKQARQIMAALEEEVRKASGNLDTKQRGTNYWPEISPPILLTDAGRERMAEWLASHDALKDTDESAD